MVSIKFGIIGNMGPEADELFQKHIRTHSNAKCDQEHLFVAVVKNPNIPDRTEAIIGKGKSPVEQIIYSVKNLEAMGVQFAVMPCNTAHHFRDEVQKATSIYIVDMLDTVMSNRKSQYCKEQEIGLLATTGTIVSGIYDKYASKYGLDLIKPSEESQERNVHAAIYGSKNTESDIRNSTGIKSGIYDDNAVLLSQAIKDMGSPCVVILGCTELPLVKEQLQELLPEITFVDPMEVTAKRVVDIYKKSETKVCKDELLFANRFKKEVDLLLIDSDEEISTYISQKALETRDI